MRKNWIRSSSLKRRAGRRRFAVAEEQDSAPQLSLQFGSRPVPTAPDVTESRDSASPNTRSQAEEQGTSLSEDPAPSHLDACAPALPAARPEPSDSILRLPAVKAATGLSRSTIYDRISKGSFPAPVSLGGNVVGWPVSVINAWLERTIVGGWKAHGRRSP